MKLASHLAGACGPPLLALRLFGAALARFDPLERGVAPFPPPYGRRHPIPKAGKQQEVASLRAAAWEAQDLSKVF